MTSAATHDQFTFKVEKEQAQKLFDASCANPYTPYGSSEEFERFWAYCQGLAYLLPNDIRIALKEFRSSGNHEGVFLLRGFYVDDDRIGCTPAHWSIEAQTKSSFETETYVLSVASVLGEVFSFQTQHAGNLVQNILPIRSDAHEQVGTGSEVFLDWHTEDAFHSLRADSIGLFCLRSDPQACTAWSSIRKMAIPEDYKRCLFERRFRAGIDKAHGGTGNAEDGPLISILTGSFADPCLRIDTSCIAAERNDAEALEALAYFIGLISPASSKAVLEQGDMLIMDNHRTLHARTPFQPRYDGTDRWLQRSSITTNLQKSRPARTQRPRVLEMGEQFLV